jgi:hypothetical protein
MVNWRSSNSPACFFESTFKYLRQVTEILNFFDLSLVEKLIKLLPSITLLSKVNGELLKLRLGEAEKDAGSSFIGGGSDDGTSGDGKSTCTYSTCKRRRAGVVK